MRPLAEHVILITGATDGLRKAVAMQLARTGATLLLHGRDEARGKRTLEEIRAQTDNTSLYWYRADFSQLAQVRVLAERLVREQERLDVLVNNAGIGTTLPGGGARQESEDGYELRFAVNYLAPFLLTRLLLPRLRQSAPARIVNVSSAGQAPINFALPHQESDCAFFKKHSLCGSLVRFQPAHHSTNFPSPKKTGSSYNAFQGSDSW